MENKEFQMAVWHAAGRSARAMPWRDNTNPYYILVSEIMLQQTQVERVIPKFNMFVSSFPTVSSLAAAPLSSVLALWNGLGYNRRAKFLWQAAGKIITHFDGKIPQNKDQLLILPGVGEATAGAILVYAFNQPVVFVETNIRTVYFNHFPDVKSDKDIALEVEKTMDNTQPREWYWALMDYGSLLKKSGNGRVAQSTHYKKQAVFKGSHREMRGRIIKALAIQNLSQEHLKRTVGADARFALALESLVVENLVTNEYEEWKLAN